MIQPSCFLDFALEWISSASSNTRLMYSSKPIIQPSIRIFTHTATPESETYFKYLKMRLMGYTITFWPWPWPRYAMVEVTKDHTSRKAQVKAFNKQSGIAELLGVKPLRVFDSP